DALQLESGHAMATIALARTLTRTERIDEAIAQYSGLVRADPTNVEVRLLLGSLLSRQRRTAEALDQWRAALKLRPDWPELLNNLAWPLATDPDATLRNGAQAVELAERACQLTEYKRAVLVGTLAAAYAEAGRFTDAVSAATKARELALAGRETDVAE